MTALLRFTAVGGDTETGPPRAALPGVRVPWEFTGLLSGPRPPLMARLGKNSLLTFPRILVD